MCAQYALSIFDKVVFKCKIIFLLLICTLINPVLSSSKFTNGKDEILLEYLYLYDFLGDSESVPYYDLDDLKRHDNRLGLVFSFPFINEFVRIDLLTAYSFLYVRKYKFKRDFIVYTPATGEHFYGSEVGSERANIIVMGIIPGIIIDKFQFGIGPCLRFIRWRVTGQRSHIYPANPSKNEQFPIRDKHVYTEPNFLNIRCSLKFSKFGFGYSSDVLKNKHGIHINYVLKRGLVFKK